MPVTLSFNVMTDVKKREFKQELENHLKGIDIQANYNDIVESTVLFAEEFFTHDYKILKKEAVMAFLQPFTNKSTLELSSQIKRVVRRKINKKGLKYFFLKIFRMLL